VFKLGLQQSPCLCVCVCVRVRACVCLWGIQNISSEWVQYTRGSGQNNICCVISRYNPNLDEIFTLQGFYAAYSGNSLRTFRPTGSDELFRNVDEELPINGISTEESVKHNSQHHIKYIIGGWLRVSPCKRSSSGHPLINSSIKPKTYDWPEDGLFEAETCSHPSSVFNIIFEFFNSSVDVPLL
jgi:hypothetical protein